MPELVLFAIAVLIAGVGSGDESKTALDHLKESTAPNFRSDHSLPPLTRWGWSMPFDVRVELAEKWGYALEFGTARPGTEEKLKNPKSTAARLCKLTADNPDKYPLCVLAYRACNNAEFRKSLPESTWCHNEDGELVEGKRIWSPEAPDEVFEKAGAEAAEPLEAIRKKAPIAIVLNGGEYGLNVYGWRGKQWKKCPRVMKAKGDMSWFEYISRRKGYQETIISNAIRKIVPKRELYLFYFTAGCPHRDRYGHWWKWAFDYKYMRKVSDVPNSSIYYKHFNSGWTGKNDMLTMALNSTARNLQLGQPLSYNWLCAGWKRKKLGDKAFGDLERYMGYLKCYYTAGMTGGVAGYFSYPQPGGFSGKVGEDIPHWLKQMMILGRAHAFFSHHEEMLRDGGLLPGPNKHRWNKNVPAYEFPTGDPEARVLARRHKTQKKWFLTAWANGGDARKVSVKVPELGEVQLQARPAGSVYYGELEDGKAVLELLDADGMHPTGKVQESGAK